MPRIRAIKPEFFAHEGLIDAEEASGVPPFSLRVAFAGLWCQADREGRFKWRPRTLKAAIMPHDDVNFPAILSALECHGFVIRYQVGDDDFGAIPSWLKHQRPHHKEQPSIIPPPAEADLLPNPGQTPGEDGADPGQAPEREGADTRTNPLGSGVWGLGSGIGNGASPASPGDATAADSDQEIGTPADQVRALFMLYHTITTRDSWAPEVQRHDLEVDLRLLLQTDGYGKVRDALEAWARRAANGEVKSHLYAFLKEYAGPAKADDEPMTIEDHARVEAEQTGRPVAEILAEWGAIRDE